MFGGRERGQRPALNFVKNQRWQVIEMTKAKIFLEQTQSVSEGRVYFMLMMIVKNTVLSVHSGK